MASNREGFNPLRPYYIPPTIGEAPDPAPSSGPSPGSFSRHGPGDRYASKARDMFSDMDYKDYLSDPSPSAVQTVRDLIDELLWKYTSVLMAQPFEVAKTVLQVRSHEDAGVPGNGIGASSSSASTPRLEKRQSSYGAHGGSSHDYDYQEESDSDPDEPAYFTSNVPPTPTPSQRARRGQHDSASVDSSRPASGKGPVSSSHLNIRLPDSITEVIGQLWQKEGAWGVWKGSNATFLYTVLSSLLENWSRSALSAVFNVPDMGVKDDLDRLIDIASPYPWASLGVAAAAAVATGLILAPLDMVRTRYVVPPSILRNLEEGSRWRGTGRLTLTFSLSGVQGYW